MPFIELTFDHLSPTVPMTQVKCLMKCAPHLSILLIQDLQICIRLRVRVPLVALSVSGLFAIPLQAVHPALFQYKIEVLPAKSGETAWRSSISWHIFRNLFYGRLGVWNGPDEVVFIRNNNTKLQHIR